MTSNCCALISANCSNRREAVRAGLHLAGRVRGLVLSRNFGHQAAVSAGYDHARGRAVLVLDADLQHPPELIPEFLAQWRAGYEVVYAYRRNVPPRFGYRLHNWLCRVTDPARGGGFPPARPGRRRGRSAGCPSATASSAASSRGSASARWASPMTSPSAPPAGRRTRWRKQLRLRIDSVFGFSTVPLRLAVLLGLVTLALGIVYAIYILGVMLIYGRESIPSGWPALIITVLVLGGVQLLCLGMVAEYVGRIYEEVKQRPLYVVRESKEPPAEQPA
jgi:glycosyltransferase involved in cell wall biosynthesis